MRLFLLMVLAGSLVLGLGVTGAWQRGISAAEGGKRETARQITDEAQALELKRQQLAEKEASLRAKEEALGKLSATLDARVAELNAAKKGLEGALVAKKKQDEERYKKMIRIYKGLKPDQAGGLLNKLDDRMVIEMLNLMDPKTAVKLIPFINQPRVLEWTRLNLAR